jgi:hypothetical protein
MFGCLKRRDIIYCNWDIILDDGSLPINFTELNKLKYDE